MTTATGATSGDRRDRQRPDRGARRTSRPLTERYQRELLAHCYRMSGSVHEAEDLVQETFLRAWKASADFQGRSSVRTWLYRIATNVCLTNLEGRPRRPLPAGLGTPDQMAGDALEQDHEIPWLEPVPDAAVVVAERDSIRLAFVAALQHLPARQRAVLILRDVLRWSAAEVAEALDTTTAAVNSALQRAHAQMADRGLTEDTVERRPRRPGSGSCSTSTSTAFWRKDIDAIVRLLTADAIWEMPPFTGWYRGAENIGRLIDTQCPGGIHDMPMLATTRQRPAGVRPLHAHQGRRLRAVPPPGARPRRRQGARTSARSSSRRCSRRSGCPTGCPPTPARRPGPGRRGRRGDHVLGTTSGSRRPARRRRRAARPRRSATPGSCSPTSPATTSTAPTPCAGWDLGRPARAHGRLPRRVHRGGRGPGRRSTPVPADGRPGRRAPGEGVRAARRLDGGPAGVGARSRSATSASTPRSWWRPPPSRSPCTAGTSARPPGRPDPIPDDLARACCRSPSR